MTSLTNAELDRRERPDRCQSTYYEKPFYFQCDKPYGHFGPHEHTSTVSWKNKGDINN